MLNLTPNVTKQLYLCVKRIRFESRTWFVLNIFEMNGEFKRVPLVSSSMLTYCLYTPKLHKQQDVSGLKYNPLDPFQ
jgi:hypothetical protein